MRNRILMNAADSSPGNGAPAPDLTATPADAPQAQGAPNAVSLEDFNSLKSTLSELAKSVNSLHAADRRSREGKPAAPKDSKDGNPPQLDALKLRALDRSLAKAGIAAELSATQYERAERAFAAEAPEDVEGWVADYFKGFGAKPAAPAPVTQPVVAAQPAAQPKPQNERPVSDRGAPPPSQVPLEEADIVTMSDSDRNALIKQKGPKWFRDQLTKQLKGRPVVLR